MRTAAVLPVKSFGRAKQRLDAAVQQPARAGLAAAMVGDVLAALGRVDALDDLVVVTAEPRAAAAARAAGAHVVHDPAETGQSDAAALGIAAAVGRGAGRTLLVPGDCPSLDPGEVAALLAGARGAGVVIVPDRHGTGTNALLLTPPDVLAPAFGPDSFARHVVARRVRRRDRAGRPCGVARARRRHAGRPGRAARRAGPAAARRAAHARAAGADGDRGMTLAAEALPGMPEIRRGDDLGALLRDAAARLPDPGLRPDDVLAVAHKAVAKAEGRVIPLSGVLPGAEARKLAAEHGKDPRLVELILAESVELVRADAGRLIARTRHGFVCANAGVDQSNAGGEEHAVLLPADPDASARALRAALGCAVVVTDSFGRAWRIGQAEVAIGCAGLGPLDDWRGRPDTAGRLLHATVIAIADEAASAADLVRDKDSGEPAVRLRGLARHVLPDDGPGVAALLRAPEQDLFG